MYHGRAAASGWWHWWHLCQFFSCSRHTYLPVYVPNEEERKDPILYANNVRQAMAQHMEKALGTQTYEHDFRDVRVRAAWRKHGLEGEPDFLAAEVARRFKQAHAARHHQGAKASGSSKKAEHEEKKAHEDESVMDQVEDCLRLYAMCRDGAARRALLQPQDWEEIGVGAEHEVTPRLFLSACAAGLSRAPWPLIADQESQDS